MNKRVRKTLWKFKKTAATMTMLRGGEGEEDGIAK
jgi:hypothetical protein